jgi:hypothetical protein
MHRLAGDKAAMWRSDMRKIALVLAILGMTLVSALYSAPAHAQATRTWISGVGDDANPCSRTAPCKTFAGAIAKTSPGGEINCLDPGGFGAVTITKAISLICDPSSNGGVLVAGTNGIVVAAGATDKVVLSGLDFEGLGSGLNGVNFISGAVVYIRNCWIHDFVNSGVNVASSTANGRVIIEQSRILFNGTNGTANTGGVTVQGNGVSNAVNINDTTIAFNQNYGVQVTGSSNVAAFLRDFITPTSISSVSSGQLISIGPSNFFNSVAPGSTVNYQ